MTIDVIIPAYRPGEEFHELVRRLSAQTVPPEHIWVINTEEEYWNKEWEDEFPLLSVRHIRRREFDHGGTRRQEAALSCADIMVFMTQDAVPCRRNMLAKLVRPLLKDDKTAAAYARQKPKKGSSLIERYTRNYNYPAGSHVRSITDTGKYGVKTFFCSNVCAAYRRSSYLEAGGFPERAIFNEDMVMAFRLMKKGYGIAYASEAEVFHSHDYSMEEQFHRNFDIGVSQREFSEVFSGIPSEGEGIRLVLNTASFLLKKGDIPDIFRLFFLSAAKYAGYFLGKHYKFLPKKTVLICTMNKEYWNRSQF